MSAPTKLVVYAKPKAAVKTNKNDVSQPPKQARRKRKPRARPGGVTTGLNGQMLVMGADASQKLHIPPPFPMGPYTVLRSRTVIDTSSSALSHKVYLIGPHFSTGHGQDNINDCICINGEGGNAPGTLEDFVLDPLVTNYANTSGSTMAQLHACTVVVATSSSMTSAQGNVHIGVLNQRIRRTSQATWNLLGTVLKTRQEMRPYTGGALLTPAKVTTYPIDVIDWGSQGALLASETATTNISKDTLGQIVVVFSPAVTTYYSISIYCEWRVNFTDTVLASTATKKAPSHNMVWDAIVNAGQATGGFLHDALGQAVNAGASQFFHYASGAFTANASPAVAGYRPALALADRTVPLMIADA